MMTMLGLLMMDYLRLREVRSERRFKWLGIGRRLPLLLGSVLLDGGFRVLDQVCDIAEIVIA